EIEPLGTRAGAAHTDGYARFLVLWAQALPETASRMVALVQGASRRMRRKITEAEAREIIDEARNTARPRTPDGWARALRLKYEVRQQIGITTIGAIDVNKRERARLRRLKTRQRNEHHPRARGARPKSHALSSTKPWKAQGISRRTWERCRKKGHTLPQHEIPKHDERSRHPGRSAA